MDALPRRKTLNHVTPCWVERERIYFVTMCTTPRRQNQLCTPDVGPDLLGSAAWYHATGRWWLQLMLLMPDHLHALLAVPPGESLPEVMRVWKSYQTRQLKIAWQSGFFDHRLRSGESAQQKADYILANPVRAGLVMSGREWPYVWPHNAGKLSARRDDSPYR